MVMVFLDVWTNANIYICIDQKPMCYLINWQSLAKINNYSNHLLCSHGHLWATGAPAFTIFEFNPNLSYESWYCILLSHKLCCFTKIGTLDTHIQLYTNTWYFSIPQFFKLVSLFFGWQKVIPDEDSLLPVHRGNGPLALQLQWTKAFSPEICLIWRKKQDYQIEILMDP